MRALGLSTGRTNLRQNIRNWPTVSGAQVLPIRCSRGNHDNSSFGSHIQGAGDSDQEHPIREKPGITCRSSKGGDSLPPQHADQASANLFWMVLEINRPGTSCFLSLPGLPYMCHQRGGVGSSITRPFNRRSSCCCFPSKCVGRERHCMSPVATYWWVAMKLPLLQGQNRRRTQNYPKPCPQPGRMVGTVPY